MDSRVVRINLLCHDDKATSQGKEVDTLEPYRKQIEVLGSSLEHYESEQQETLLQITSQLCLTRDLEEQLLAAHSAIETLKNKVLCMKAQLAGDRASSMDVAYLPVQPSSVEPIAAQTKPIIPRLSLGQLPDGSDTYRLCSTSTGSPTGRPAIIHLVETTRSRHMVSFAESAMTPATLHAKTWENPMDQPGWETLAGGQQRPELPPFNLPCRSPSCMSSPLVVVGNVDEIRSNTSGLYTGSASPAGTQCLSLGSSLEGPDASINMKGPSEHVSIRHPKASKDMGTSTEDGCQQHPFTNQSLPDGLNTSERATSMQANNTCSTAGSGVEQQLRDALTREGYYIAEIARLRAQLERKTNEAVHSKQRLEALQLRLVALSRIVTDCYRSKSQTSPLQSYYESQASKSPWKVVFHSELNRQSPQE